MNDVFSLLATVQKLFSWFNVCVVVVMEIVKLCSLCFSKIAIHRPFIEGCIKTSLHVDPVVVFGCNSSVGNRWYLAKSIKWFSKQVIRSESYFCYFE